MTQTTPLHIRAAQVDITPKRPLSLFGRAGRGASFQAIKSKLEANCILIGETDQITAVVAIDSLYPSQTLSKAIRETLALKGIQLEETALLMVASHTHNAPALDETKPRLGNVDTGYLSEVADQIADCLADLATTPVQQAAIAHSIANCAASVFRRRQVLGIDLSRLRFSARTIMAPNPRTKINQMLKLYVVKDTSGRPIAALWTWPCHAVSEVDGSVVSADYPGVVRDHLRETLGISALPVLYFPGFSGDIRPVSRSLLPLHKSGKWFAIAPRFAKVEEPHLSALHSLLRAAIDQAVGTLSDADFTVRGTQLAKRQIDLADLRTDCADMMPITCTDWSIGPITLKAVSAEVASGYDDPCGGSDPLTVLTGCAQQVFGYIPLDHQLTEGGYEVDGFTKGFSVAGAFRDKIEAKVTRLIRP